jgi:hypothetical protein
MAEMSKETFTLEHSTQSMSQFTIEPDALESETSADELSQDMSQDFSFSHNRLKRESEKRSSNSDIKVRFKKSYSEASSRSCSRGRLS